MAKELDFSVEDALYQRALRDLQRVSKTTWADVLKKEARLMAVSLAFQTQPFGDSNAAKLIGEKAVTRDLAAVYADAPRTFAVIRQKDENAAKGFYKAMLQGDWKEARRILAASGSRWRNVEIEPFDAAIHRHSRDRRGRVKRHTPGQIVTNFKKADAYKKQKIRMVGFAKAGWASAASGLSGNTRGIPGFVTRHKNKAPGRAIDNTNKLIDPHVELQNNVRYIRSACPPAQRAAALKIQREKLYAHILKRTKEDVRKTMGTIATTT
jgi:hypothetical protein